MASTLSQSADSPRKAEFYRVALLSRIVTSKLVAAAICYLISIVVTIVISKDLLTLVLGVTASLSLFSGNLVGALSSYYQSQLRMAEAFPPTLFAFGLYVAASLSAIFRHLPLALVVCFLPICELLNFFLLKRKIHNIPAVSFRWICHPFPVSRELASRAHGSDGDALFPLGQYPHLQVYR